MLHELKRDEFDRISHLLVGARINLETRAIAAGNSPGWVLVDDSEHPQTALVFSRGQEGFYFVGEEDNPAFEAEIWPTIQTLLPRLRIIGVNRFEYSGTSLAWDASLERLFAHENCQPSNQYVYMLPSIAEIRFPIHPKDGGFSVKAITKELLEDPGVDSSFLERILLDWWDSLATFLEFGSGYCVICQEKAVALCYTSFVADQQNWELGVDTHSDFRKRGFARTAMGEMLRECQEEGVIPYWDCMETNTPSRRLAEGFGFKVAFIYKVYCFKHR